LLDSSWKLQQVEMTISLQKFVILNPAESVSLYLQDKAPLSKLDATLTAYIRDHLNIPMSDEEFTQTFSRT